MDLIAGIKASVAAGQSSFTPEVGAGLLVGVRLAFVTSMGPGPDGTPAVTLQYEDGAVETMSLEGLREYALARVDWRPKGNTSAAFLDTVWAVAGARSIPMDMRAAYVARAVSRAVSRARTDEDTAQGRAWLAALLRGVEPSRV